MKIRILETFIHHHEFLASQELEKLSANICGDINKCIF